MTAHTPINALLIDDDQDISQLLSEYLLKYGIHTDSVPDGPGMQAAMAHKRYDVLILDVMLPGEDGLVLCQKVRANSHIPILMLTARGDATDRVVGLELGADDYMVKPFDPREVVARIRSLLRRSQLDATQHGAQPVRFDGWTLDPVSREITTPAKLLVPLSNAEYRLLNVFLARPRRVLSRDQLLDAARGQGVEVLDRSIDLLVSRLRSKLGDDPYGARLIRTIRGEGYLLDVKVIT